MAPLSSTTTPLYPGDRMDVGTDGHGPWHLYQVYDHVNVRHAKARLPVLRSWTMVLYRVRPQSFTFRL